jgi:hypothetical protein
MRDLNYSEMDGEANSRRRPVLFLIDVEPDARGAPDTAGGWAIAGEASFEFDPTTFA